MFLKDLKEFNLPKSEEKVLEFWRKNQVFEKSLKGGSGVKRKTFVFYEGPPTANGRPGIHHVIARVFKDVILRYKTMRGYFVPRKAGWDTHGLPVEIQVEKALGLKSKKEIEKYGIAEFNKKCRESVWQFKDEFERLTERMGYWLDMKNPYVTYEKDYIETLWWIIAQFWKKKLLYKGNRIVNWCPRCGTGLSSHEMALGYKEVVDNSVYVKFQLKYQVSSIRYQALKKKKTYVLSWTTTPWTLPGNVALAVGDKIDYVFVEVDKEILVVAKERMKEIGLEGKIIKEVKGKDLLGLSYEPLFEVEALKNKNAYKVYAADFVTTTDGTGVVHTAVMYGEDDYKLGMKVGLPQHHTVDEAGKFTKDVQGLAGLYVKAKETEEKIFAHLKANSNLLKVEPYTHEYPHCWRCSTPLLYYARSAWFVAMSKLKKELIANNEDINWIPAHMKEGRFGEWLKDVKDWNFSRERYWGTPLPIWECKKCGHFEATEGLDDLNKKAGGARNEYWIMRHGESEAQLLGRIDSGKAAYHLTTKGKEQVEKSAKMLASEKIDLIFASPVLRTKETAKIVEKIIGKKAVFDKRLAEINLPTFAGKGTKDYWEAYPTYHERFQNRPPKGESLSDVRTRGWDLVSDLEKKYKGKKILLISHEYPIWAITQAVYGWTEEEAIKAKEEKGRDFIKVAEFNRLELKIVPRDETAEVNLHRPYADQIIFNCEKCDGKMNRVKELCDVWFDSGAMPLAQAHFPFSEKRVEFPADYICEAVDQTRGWFYTLLAVATALGKSAPYKNVISLGHINDKHGQKMSKSKGNVVDPWIMAEKYGMDAVRWYFYTATPPGEPKNFDEQEILKTYRRFHLMLWNSLVFYRTYAINKSKVISYKSKGGNVLDEWILVRLDETVTAVTKNFDKYQIREAALEIEKLTDDLSRWYIRRSRRRLQKPESKSDFEACSVTLGYVIVSILKLMAPFNPFFSEVLWNVLGGKDSIHLEGWPETKSKIKNQKSKVVEQMEEVRRVAALGLAKRAEAGIKVRQPLASLKLQVQSSKLKNSEDLLKILAEEVNVKEVVFSKNVSNEVELDTNITPELREEGHIREFMRMIQDLRQKAGLEPKDGAVLMAELPSELREVVEKNEAFIKKEAGVRTIEYKKSEKFDAEAVGKFEEQEIWLALRRLK